MIEPNRKIINRPELTTSPERDVVLDVVEAGFAAIDTATVIATNVSWTAKQLRVGESFFPLAPDAKLIALGIGKNADQATPALAAVLGDRLTAGFAIGLTERDCGVISCQAGTHPLPSPRNVALSEKMVGLTHGLTEDDLVIVIVSGGGSALLCWPESELIQGERLYREFLTTGGTISELNTIRKHLSGLKGGGLVKLLYPARVVALIFSDVPGNHWSDVASGPTYRDTSTVHDARSLLDRYGLRDYELTETPKEARYFEKLHNVPLMSNLDALTAMAEHAHAQGIKVKTLSAEMYDSPERVARLMFAAAEPNCVVLAAGEPRIVVTSADGSGGRCQRVGMAALPLLQDGDCFAAIASDGLDNSDAAGIVEDGTTLERLNEQKIDLDGHWNRFDGYTLYSKLGHELIRTGPTGANVSDLFVLYRK